VFYVTTVLSLVSVLSVFDLINHTFGRHT